MYGGIFIIFGLIGNVIGQLSYMAFTKGKKFMAMGAIYLAITNPKKSHEIFSASMNGLMQIIGVA